MMAINISIKYKKIQQIQLFIFVLKKKKKNEFFLHNVLPHMYSIILVLNFKYQLHVQHVVRVHTNTTQVVHF